MQNIFDYLFGDLFDSDSNSDESDSTGVNEKCKFNCSVEIKVINCSNATTAVPTSSTNQFTTPSTNIASSTSDNVNTVTQASTFLDNHTTNGMISTASDLSATQSMTQMSSNAEEVTVSTTQEVPISSEGSISSIAPVTNG